MRWTVSIFPGQITSIDGNKESHLTTTGPKVRKETVLHGGEVETLRERRGKSKMERKSIEIVGKDGRRERKEEWLGMVREL
jgi:hypothetical protein